MAELLKHIEIPPGDPKISSVARFSTSISLSNVYPSYHELDVLLRENRLSDYIDCMLSLNPPVSEHKLSKYALSTTRRTKKDDYTELRSLMNIYADMRSIPPHSPDELAESLLLCILPLCSYYASAATEPFEDTRYTSILRVANGITAQWVSWITTHESVRRCYSVYTPYSVTASVVTKAQRHILGDNYLDFVMRKKLRSRKKGEIDNVEDENTVKAAQDWKDDANCRGANPTLFLYASTHNAARVSCGDCGVVSECQNFGSATGSTGTFGGQWLKNGIPTIARRPGRPSKQTS